MWAHLVPTQFKAYTSCVTGRKHGDCISEWGSTQKAARTELEKTFEGRAGHPMHVRIKESYLMFKICGGDTKSDTFLNCYPRIVCGDAYFAAQKCAVANGGDLKECKSEAQALGSCMGEWGFLPPKNKT